MIKQNNFLVVRLRYLKRSERCQQCPTLILSRLFPLVPPNHPRSSAAVAAAGGGETARGTPASPDPQRGASEDLARAEKRRRPLRESRRSAGASFTIHFPRRPPIAKPDGAEERLFSVRESGPGSSGDAQSFVKSKGKHVN